jgi:hypothetical protein
MLTACFVTRNHARDLPAALAAARPAAGHLLVLDTGSTDGTPEVARAAGATVVAFAWADDFAAACNAAVAAAPTDWVLWLNPDERLAPGAADRLIEAARAPDVLAYSLLVQQQTAADRPAYGTSNRQWRLFRKHDALRFRGRLHPALTPTPQAVAPELGFECRPLDAIIVRHAYLNEVTPDKVRFTNRLIEAELRDRPDQPALVVELGTNLVRLGDPRGHEVLADASRAVKAALDANQPPPPGVAPLFEYLLTTPEVALRGPLDRAAARRATAAWYADAPPVLWAFAQDRFAHDDFATASVLLARLLELGRTASYDPAFGFDPDIVGRAAMFNLGLCHVRLNRPDAARDCFTPLVTDPHHGPRATDLLAKLPPKLAKE